MNKVIFTDPLGNDEENPSPAEIEELILAGDPKYWHNGSGEMGLRFFTNSERRAALYLRRGAEAGLWVDYKDYQANGGGGLQTIKFGHHTGETIAAMNAAGEITSNYREYYVPPEVAWEAAEHFLATGAKKPSLDWEKAVYPE